MIPFRMFIQGARETGLFDASERFIAQSETGDLKTKTYPKIIQGPSK